MMQTWVSSQYIDCSEHGMRSEAQVTCIIELHKNIKYYYNIYHCDLIFKSWPLGELLTANLQYCFFCANQLYHYYIMLT